MPSEIVCVNAHKIQLANPEKLDFPIFCLPWPKNTILGERAENRPASFTQYKMVFRCLLGANLGGVHGEKKKQKMRDNNNNHNKKKMKTNKRKNNNKEGNKTNNMKKKKKTNRRKRER